MGLLLQEKIEKFKQMIDESDNIVFFGGAGVSTESGIPDFRSIDGLYHLKYEYPPETMLSHTFFMKHTDKFYEFYWDKMVYENAEPNITHVKLAELERQGKLKAVVTQNIDGLHQKAGSINVLELHGSVYRYNCMSCGRFYSLEKLRGTKGVPVCGCGGIIKPDVVLYEEGLDDEVVSKAIRAISKTDVLIIGGTSLSVYPAAGFISYYRGNKKVIINKSPTPFDREADLLIQAGLGEVFSQI